MPGVGKYSATVNGTGETGMRGIAIGPRSFSMWREIASRIVSWIMIRPETMARTICPLPDARSRSPTSTTAPSTSVRTGTMSR